MLSPRVQTQLKKPNVFVVGNSQIYSIFPSLFRLFLYYFQNDSAQMMAVGLLIHVAHCNYGDIMELRLSLRRLTFHRLHLDSTTEPQDGYDLQDALITLHTRSRNNDLIYFPRGDVYVFVPKTPLQTRSGVVPGISCHFSDVYSAGAETGPVPLHRDMLHNWEKSNWSNLGVFTSCCLFMHFVIFLFLPSYIDYVVF